MQAAGTDVDSQGTYSATIAGVSSDSVDHFLAYLTGGNLKHAADPSTNSSAMNQSASSIISKSLNSTVMLGVLHGSPTIISDSDMTGTFDHDDISAEVAAKVTPKIPGFNLVVYWACKTFNLNSGTSGWDDAYGISANYRAFMGYAQSIIALCWTEEEWDEAEAAGANNPYDAQIAFSSDISDNVEILLDHLSVGLTIGEARVIAHNQIPMVEVVYLNGVPNFSKVASLVDGDYLTRLRYIYLSTAERETMANQSRSFDIPLVKLPIQ
jgi:hypothetical protein